MLYQSTAKIYNSSLSILALYHIPLIYDTESSAGEKAGDVDETIYARFTRNRASNLFQGPSQGIKLVTTRAHNFQNDKFIYRADNFRTPSIAIILNE